MRKLACLVGLFLFASLPVVAQETASKDVTVEYSFLRAHPASAGIPSFDANGGSASFTYNPRRWYGFEGEFAGYHVGQIGTTAVNTNLFTYMFGPQIHFRNFGRFAPFAEQLFGLAHSGGGSLGIPASRNSFAMAVGAGVDMPLRGHLSARFGPVDYLLTQFSETTAAAGRKAQNNLRISGGVRYRF